jgi:anaerobic selenocysteine-containing dehydrogenase
LRLPGAGDLPPAEGSTITVMAGDELRATKHFRACNLCEAICGLAIEVRGREILAIRGDRDDPFSRGHVCPKAVALQDLHNDPDRLRQPLRREDGAWRTVSWEEALDDAARRIRSVQDRHGRDAVAVYLGNPTVHSWGALLFAPALIRCLQPAATFSATSVDQLPHHVAALLMFGHKLLLPVPDIDRTRHLLMLGANPLVSNGSMMTAPGVARRLAELRARGGTLVVVDPRRTETAAQADRHHFIRPGTDALLLAALLRTILDEKLARPGRLAAWCDGLEELPGLLADFEPRRVAAATGIPAEDIVAMARSFAAAPAAVCYGRMGVSTQSFGSLCQWLINLLNLVTGNLDRPGGAMFTAPAVDLVARTGAGRLGGRRSRTRGLPAFGGELPVAALAEEILGEGPGRIRALITVAGNPVLSTPNGPALERALESLELLVAVDPYLNETTRHADLVLPPTSALERDQYDLVFNLLAVRNVARYSPALFEPGPEQRHDWQILEGLRCRLDRGTVGERWRRWLSARLGPRRLLDLGLRSGPYGSGLRPFGRGLDLAALGRAPHGLDLGPLEPCLPGRLRTHDQRIAAAPAPLVADLPRLERALEELPPEGSLTLIGRRHLRSNNSWMHNSARLMGGRERCVLLMNPTDAARLGLAAGSRVAVVSRVGRIEVPLEPSDEVMPGVVSLPHGWGHHRPGTRLTVAEAHAGASANDLTDEQAVDPVCGNAVLNGVPVRVEAVADARAVSPGRTSRR